MTFPRVSSLVLAIGGSYWAFLLLGFTFQILHYSAGGLVFLLMLLPGFIAWYAYIRRAFGHYLWRRARLTWLVSVAANLWSLSLGWGQLGVIALVWVVGALVLSTICAVLEWEIQEPAPHPPADIPTEEFRKLLDEHRKRER